MESDIGGLKAAMSLRDYVKQFLKDFIKIERETQNVSFSRCIFHQENTASLAFYDQRFYCFGCGKSGDVIDLVMYLKKLDFKEACLEIASNVGYEISFEPPNPVWEKFYAERLQLARRYFLNLQSNADAMNYLLNVRHISPETIYNFMLGFTDAEEYKYRQDMGNISSKIVFPIFDSRRTPTIAGMAYRAMTDEKPKYVNDHNQTGQNGQNSALNGAFIKGNMLYGFYQARTHIADEGYAIITEGYFDVLSLHDSRIGNAVGVMSAKLTEAQADMLAKRTSKAILMLDADDAGKTGTMNAIKMLMSRGIVSSVCQLQDVHDADELCNKYSHDKNTILQYIKGHLITSERYLLDKLTSKYKDLVIVERNKVVSEAMSICESISDKAQREVFMNMVYKEIDMI